MSHHDERGGLCDVTVQPAGETPIPCGLELPCPRHGDGRTMPPDLAPPSHALAHIYFDQAGRTAAWLYRDTVLDERLPRLDIPWRPCPTGARHPNGPICTHHRDGWHVSVTTGRRLIAVWPDRPHWWDGLTTSPVARLVKQGRALRDEVERLSAPRRERMED